MSSNEIDHALLPKCALLDTGVIMRALGDRPNDPRTPVCLAFLRAMRECRRTVYVSALSLAEILRKDDGPPTPSVQLPHVPGVVVLGFDRICATKLGSQIPVSRLLQTRDKSGAVLHYWKYDSLIVAAALAYDATLVSMDGGAAHLARQVGVTVARPEDFTGRQLSLRTPPEDSDEGAPTHANETEAVSVAAEGIEAEPGPIEGTASLAEQLVAQAAVPGTSREQTARSSSAAVAEDVPSEVTE